MKMIRQSSGISLKSNGIFSTRSLSSLQLSETPAPAVPATAAAAPLNFVQQRIAYQAQLTELKKGWTKQMAQKKERDALLAKLEREKITLRQAIRLREDRAQALINAEKQRINTEKARARFRQHLANNEAVREKRQALQQCRYTDMVQQLHEESAVWITKENIEQRITGRLFDDYATTGLVTRTSNYWRYMTIPYVVGKNFGHEEPETQPTNGKYYANSVDKGGMNPMERKYQTNQMKMAEHLLNQMISTGAEREKYDDYLFHLGSMLEAGHKEAYAESVEDEDTYATDDPYGYVPPAPKEISRAEWLVQQHESKVDAEDREERNQWDEEIDEYVPQEGDEVEEVVILPPKPTGPGAKAVKRVPRKR